MQRGIVSRRLLLEQCMRVAVINGVRRQWRVLRTMRNDRRRVLGDGAMHMQRRGGVHSGAALLPGQLHLRFYVVSERLLLEQQLHLAVGDRVRRRRNGMLDVRNERRRMLGDRGVHVQRRAGVQPRPTVPGGLRLRCHVLHEWLLFERNVHHSLRLHLRSTRSGLHAMRSNDGERLLGFGRVPMWRQPAMRWLQRDVPVDGRVRRR